jgi:hypothetical protein
VLKGVWLIAFMSRPPGPGTPGNTEDCQIVTFGPVAWFDRTRLSLFASRDRPTEAGITFGRNGLDRHLIY